MGLKTKALHRRPLSTKMFKRLKKPAGSAIQRRLNLWTCGACQQVIYRAIIAKSPWR